MVFAGNAIKLPIETRGRAAPLQGKARQVSRASAAKSYAYSVLRISGDPTGSS